MSSDVQRPIKSHRLTLEPLTVAHAEAMFEVLGDPLIYRYENAPPVSVEALRARYARLGSRRSPSGSEQWLNWVARLPGTGPIGYVQATVHADGRAAIAYEFASRYWGQGLASEAVSAMLGDLAGRHGATSASAVFKRANERSKRLLERLGFEPSPDSAIEIEADESLMTRSLA